MSQSFPNFPPLDASRRHYMLKGISSKRFKSSLRLLSVFFLVFVEAVVIVEISRVFLIGKDEVRNGRWSTEELERHALSGEIVDRLFPREKRRKQLLLMIVWVHAEARPALHRESTWSL